MMEREPAFETREVNASSSLTYPIQLLPFLLFQHWQSAYVAMKCEFTRRQLTTANIYSLRSADQKQSSAVLWSVKTADFAYFTAATSATLQDIQADSNSVTCQAAAHENTGD